MPTTTWLGRILHHDRARAVRVRTGGTSPSPDARVELIDDPLQSDDPFEFIDKAEAVDAGALSDFELLPPIKPSKVIGIGRNFRAHAAELGNEVPETPLSFMKAPSCLLGSGRSIDLPRGYERIDMEAELVVVIGRVAKSVEASRAWRHVLGYTLGNDVSCRDLQRSDKQWTRAKGFDGFGPLGPLVRLTPPGFVPPLPDMRIQGLLDDELRQDGSLADLIFPIGTLIEHLSACMTLEPGDLIFTGTPAGVPALSPGCTATVEMRGFDLGRLSNPVV
jgi:2-keto-4-pentenoate hydratase/2-oxohepta-3-ene-1,7-dioic acid hydratase in catechol pathway